MRRGVAGDDSTDCRTRNEAWRGWCRSSGATSDSVQLQNSAIVTHILPFWKYLSGKPFSLRINDIRNLYIIFKDLFIEIPHARAWWKKYFLIFVLSMGNYFLNRLLQKQRRIWRSVILNPTSHGESPPLCHHSNIIYYHKYNSLVTPDKCCVQNSK